MALKNKALKADAFKQGKMSFSSKGWFSEPQKSPLLFANSSELTKIQNRNSKKRK